MRPISAFRSVGVLACALTMASVTGCFDDEPVAPAHSGASTVVVSRPGVTSPQPTVVQQAPAPQSAPPVINNIVQPPAAAPAPAPAPAPATPAPGTTVNVQPRTVTVP